MATYTWTPKQLACVFEHAAVTGPTWAMVPALERGYVTALLGAQQNVWRTALVTASLREDESRSRCSTPRTVADLVRAASLMADIVLYDGLVHAAGLAIAVLTTDDATVHADAWAALDVLARDAVIRQLMAHALLLERDNDERRLKYVFAEVVVASMADASDVSDAMLDEVMDTVEKTESFASESFMLAIGAAMQELGEGQIAEELKALDDEENSA